MSEPKKPIIDAVDAALQHENAGNAPAEAPVASAVSSKRPKKIILAGLDLGTNNSCIIAGNSTTEDYEVTKLVPTMVGYVRDGIVNGIVPGEANVLFGEEAIENRLHLDLHQPVIDGVVSNLTATKDYVKWLRRMIDPSGDSEIRAVIGIPASASENAREITRKSVTGVFEKVLLIPEPFLAALGFRDDRRLRQRDYVDPVMNSLVIDIGAGTTDLCLVQGYFPRRDEQISFAHAGDRIDQEIKEGLAELYPDLKLTPIQVCEIKERNSYVGPSRRPIDERIIVQGKGRTIEVADIVGGACNRLFEEIFKATCELIGRAAGDSATQLLKNILITGGGSRIRGIDTLLQKRLIEEGYEAPRVRALGEDYKRFVGIGAIKAARSARENQWQVLFP